MLLLLVLKVMFTQRKKFSAKKFRKFESFYHVYAMELPKIKEVCSSNPHRVTGISHP